MERGELLAETGFLTEAGRQEKIEFPAALEAKGIHIGTHIYSCAQIPDRTFDEILRDGLSQSELADILLLLREKAFPVLNEDAGEKMKEKIREASQQNDSVGGITETMITGLPAGVGEPWFDSVESELSHILFSIGGVKGVEFGSGFALADMTGSIGNDALRYKEDGTVYTESNHNGGINGGITNGMPVLFRCAFKPTASIAKEQKSIDFLKKENINYKGKGRHDPAIVRRACPVIDCVAAIAVADLLTGRYGTDYLA